MALQGPAGWLAAGVDCRRPGPGHVRRGRSLRHLPECARAWAGGDITAAQVDVIAGLRSDATAEALARDEKMLVAQASTMRYSSSLGRRPTGSNSPTPMASKTTTKSVASGRDVYLESSFGGMWLGKITLDPISGSIVGPSSNASNEPCSRRNGRRHARTRTRAHLPRSAPDPRPASSRRSRRDGDAESDGSEATGGGPRRCSASWSTTRHCAVGYVSWPEAPSSPRARSFPGWTRRTSSGWSSPRTRRVEVSATARLFSGATRRAIELRDRECTHPYCDVPASSCQVDHIVPFTDGGPTIEENGRLLCGFHNRLRTADRLPTIRSGVSIRAPMVR